MDDPDVTMEEYIPLEAEKAHIDYFKDFETDFSAIVYKDAMTSEPKVSSEPKLMEAIEKRFGGNAATKKTQRNLLKQQYENFTASSKKISQEDVNQKLLRSLSSEWNTHAVVWRNKSDLDTMSMDDLYNNLKVFEPEVKGVSSSSTNTHNMAFVSSSSNNNTNSSNEAVNTAFRVTTAGTQVNTTYKPDLSRI
nr:ribonuclease H-like domain-containing protein [Tanacetum cinerariifolium]